ncbi:cellulose biosynthesis cyclic di-GMP-binding regulatory protein BcsB [Bosea rubneri]|uniref:Cyclic di-GMP-binding protein n=1 Tax=Bosea rubneri TaxID=3075434 RepID=A0ABU3SEA4_9HYPH|nr:cellulose biosynthesis cyclic di-GMP-binding regulatory protein BcsB [Bosea sp. ZW T0_25]MDU0342720.1 cellulose biosynthesis cyclic di-GMP-binding regulatory protein BcsB [Bosea sp. ZW T0_25]
MTAHRPPLLLRGLAVALAMATAPALAQQPGAATNPPPPFMIAPGTAPTAPALTPAAPAPMTSKPAAAPAPAAGPGFKPLLPAARVTLEGEADTRSWAFYLTEEEANSDLALDIAFQNALVVMPEASRLTVRVNGERVVETPVASSDRMARLSTNLRKGLLRPGQNTIRFEAIQRHRTDCSVASTYELWTRIDGAGTKLSFRSPSAAELRLRSIDDLPAIGADETGQTTIRIVAPGASSAAAANMIFAVSQAAALRGRYGQAVVQVSERAPGRARPGTLTIVLATTAELPELLTRVPEEAKARSFVGFISDARLGPSTLLVTGASWPDIENVVATLLTAPVSRPTNLNRRMMDTSSWHLPDAPFLSEARALRFSELGIASQESSARRLRTRAVVAFPGDFYAAAYGEATLYLDAAYSADVLPGDSHIEVFVNGNVAATVPLNATTGGLFQQFPITLPLRHFRPGINEIWFEAVTLTSSDLSCGPGATLPGRNRFALFDTTSLSFPDFAKIGVQPNLAAVAGTGFPYSLATRTPLILGRHDTANYGAAATLLARLAQRAARPLAVDALTSVSTVSDQPALIVGAASQLPPGLLPRVGVSETVRTTWPTRADAVVVAPENDAGAVFDAVINRFQGQKAPAVAENTQPTTDALRDRWRSSLGGPLARYFVAFDQWLQRNFHLSFAQLRIPSSNEALYEPADGTDLIAAQAVEPASKQVWTAFVARREETLEATIARLVTPGNWANLAGRVTAFRGTQDVHVVAANDPNFVMTRSFSLTNMRLILANWLSDNIGAYALALLAACIALGISTSLMLGRLGQKP